MSLNYIIKYKATNFYDNFVQEALWQFLIAPLDLGSQQLVYSEFKNSLNIPTETSVNGYGFTTYRVHPKTKFNKIEFEAKFHVLKEKYNPFENINQLSIEQENKILDSLEFKVHHSLFLKETALTKLPKHHTIHFTFSEQSSAFENLKNLNKWIFDTFSFKVNVTDVDTDLDIILEEKQGVCQDFTHLFCAVARSYKIPTRYVSGYLHQGNGYFGDSQMHAWTEAFIPDCGWIGFDPTNNLIAAENHIKVAHGKDYSDCPPIKGVIYAEGANRTEYSVDVHAQQNMQQ
ncbi:transglutaminase-like domain-containing protein [Zunongwangia sp. HGR-M22]|uniref:transglutaminase-like domain-containing protein n=1 Tax=Zunongwangia sp. HGR-M22 TaxID=3015168 RepID=UPI0022DE3F35|nr:transglutaminase family protein [Zunongwangia sp. HGR-M22]WBL24398.1 transglutaminase family protein [Zunongwangia sp. HGR-M22]